MWVNFLLCISIPYPVNDGDYVEAVLDRNHAENISRVLYPNDNVSNILTAFVYINYHPYVFLSALSLCFKGKLFNVNHWSH